jgi:uncharacterized protein (DUF983 family)
MENRAGRCSECGREMEGIRVEDFPVLLPDGTKMKEVIDDRCPKCRDSYGVILDALTAAVGAVQEDVKELPIST